MHQEKTDKFEELVKNSLHPSKNLRIEEQHPVLSENIQILEQILLPLEITILQLMISYGKPTTTQAVYSTMVNEIFRVSLFDTNVTKQNIDVNFKIDKSILESIPDNKFKKFGLKTKEIIKSIEIEEYFLPVNQSALIDKKTFKSKYDKSQMKMFLNGGQLTPLMPYFKLSFTEKTRIKEILLRDLNFYFPSFAKIHQTLETLESWNFLSRRNETIKSKSTFLWILNPQFSLKFQNKFNEIQKLKGFMNYNITSLKS